jgi:S1-C subfamily serine protease
MNKQILKPVIWMGVFILIVSIACSAGSGSSTDEPQPATTAEQPSTEAPDPEPSAETEEPAMAAGGVDDLQDVKVATIQVEAQGTFIDPEVGLVQNGAGRGSGFIIDPSGIAVTNNHVVTGAALLKVWVGGEDTPRNAKVLGVSECSDLAVIDIDGEGFEYLDWYDGSIDVGMDMYIAGYPLGDPEYTLTKGVISKAKADGETYWSSVDSVVEYDATSNPGNSGGPVVTSDGKVLAIHYAGNAQTRQAFGISKAIATGIIEELQMGDDIDTIGVNGQAVGTEDGSITGIWVSSIQSGSPADQAGVQPGDIITEMESLVLATDGTLSQYCDILRSHQPSDTLSLQVLRWSSGEVLEGQLNGRQLEVMSVADVTTDGDTTVTDTGDPYIDENASQSGDPYYYAEFEGGLDDWFYFLTNGDDLGFNAQAVDGRLQIDIGENDTWVYLMNDYFEYEDVRIDTVAENLGRNNNNVSLICRESDQGWYEFNIANNGTYTILWFDDVTKHDYVLLYSGGSTEIRMGKDINEYTAVCAGDQLTLGINGVEVRTVTDKNLKSGRVGLSVSSFNVTPILVEFDYFITSVP